MSKSTKQTSVKKASKASTNKSSAKSSAKSSTKRGKASPSAASISKSNVRQRKHLSVEDLDFENDQSLEDYYDAMDILSEKEVMFCMEYVNNGMIAKLAYSKVFGNENLATCAVNASKLIRKTKIKRFLRKELDLRAARLGISSDHIAYKYKVWSEAFIGDFIEIKEVNDRQVLFLKANLNDLTDEQKSCIKSIEPTKDGQIKITMVDQKAALDSLSKLLGYNNEKLLLKTEGSLVLKFDSQDEEA